MSLKSHAKYINSEDFIVFLKIAKNHNFDVMIEAKKQDAALFKLREELKACLSV